MSAVAPGARVARSLLARRSAHLRAPATSALSSIAGDGNARRARVLGPTDQAPRTATWSLASLAEGPVPELSDEDVELSAKLSHLALPRGTEAFERAATDMRAVLRCTAVVQEYVDGAAAPNDDAVTTGTNPVLRGRLDATRLRDDEVSEGGDVEAVLGGAKERYGDYLSVPKVLD